MKLAKAFAVNRLGEASRLTTPGFQVTRAGEASRVIPPRRAVKRTPFLHPKAKDFDPATSAQRMQWSGPFTELQNKALPQGRNYQAKVRFARSMSAGPKAPPKVLRALSGKDYGETISRLGRATRRQKREFAAIVHPLSGRVLDMRRGGPVSAGYGVGSVAGARTSRLRMARLADKAQNPAVRARAAANLEGKNTRIQGPQPVFVHNHPIFEHAGKPHARRYPSGADLSSMHAFPKSRHVVLTHKPGPRGSKQTQAVTTRVTNPTNVAANAQRIGQHDYATQGPLVPTAARAQKIPEHQLREMVEMNKPKGKRLKSYDTFMRQKTASQRAAKKSGMQTTVTMHKQANPFGVNDAGRLG